jgi:hypothetical protein
MNEDDHMRIPKLPMQVGDSDQFISGFIALNRPMELVQITVKRVDGEAEYSVGPVPVPAPVDAFVEALNRWRASLVYPTTPKVRTRTLDASELESYCLRYRQAYELMGEGPTLPTGKQAKNQSLITSTEERGRKILSAPYIVPPFLV